MKASRAIPGAWSAMRPKMTAKSPLSAMIHQLRCTMGAAMFCIREFLLLSFVHVETTIVQWFRSNYILKARRKTLTNRRIEAFCTRSISSSVRGTYRMLFLEAFRWHLAGRFAHASREHPGARAQGAP